MKLLKPLILVLFLLLAAGCTQSKADIKEVSIDEAKQAFENNGEKANNKTEQFSFYLPENYKVEKEDKYNVILAKGAQRYILFVNENEEENSQVSYDTLVKQYENPFISKTFKKNDKLGYLFVHELDSKKYEVTVGIGGTKLTTETELKNITEDARNMMDIVSSIQ